MLLLVGGYFWINLYTYPAFLTNMSLKYVYEECIKSDGLLQDKVEDKHVCRHYTIFYTPKCPKITDEVVYIKETDLVSKVKYVCSLKKANSSISQ